jgi:hypothetical protein
VTAGVLRHGDQGRGARPFDVQLAHAVAGRFGRDHAHVHKVGRRDLLVVNVEAVREHQGIARLEIRLDVLFVDFGLNGVRDQDHDDIGFGSRFSRRLGFEAIGDRLVPVVRAGHFSDDDFDAAVAQVLGMSVPLAAVPDNGDRLVFKQRQVGITVVIEFCHRKTLLWKKPGRASPRKARGVSLPRDTGKVTPVLRPAAS